MRQEVILGFGAQLCQQLKGGSIHGLVVPDHGFGKFVDLGRGADGKREVGVTDVDRVGNISHMGNFSIAQLRGVICKCRGADGKHQGGSEQAFHEVLPFELVSMFQIESRWAEL